MTYYLEYSCYSSNHIKWIALVSLPILIVWVIGLPVMTLIFLIKNRRRLQEIVMQSYFLILYQGFKEGRFYWEFLSSFRKFVILSINSMLNNFSVNYKILVSVACLIGFYYFQKSMAPYKSAENNRIDLLGISSATVTIFTGVIFSLGNEVHSSFYTLTLLLIIVVNSYFILSWAYLFMVSIEYRNSKYIFLVNLVGFLLCKSRIKKEDLHSVIESEEKGNTTPKRRVFGKKTRSKGRRFKARKKVKSKEKKSFDRKCEVSNILKHNLANKRRYQREETKLVSKPDKEERKMFSLIKSKITNEGLFESETITPKSMGTNSNIVLTPVKTLEK